MWQKVGKTELRLPFFWRFLEEETYSFAVVPCKRRAGGMFYTSTHVKSHKTPSFHLTTLRCKPTPSLETPSPLPRRPLAESSSVACCDWLSRTSLKRPQYSPAGSAGEEESECDHVTCEVAPETGICGVYSSKYYLKWKAFSFILRYSILATIKLYKLP